MTEMNPSYARFNTFSPVCSVRAERRPVGRRLYSLTLHGLPPKAMRWPMQTMQPSLMAQYLRPEPVQAAQQCGQARGECGHRHAGACGPDLCPALPELLCQGYPLSLTGKLHCFG